MGSVSSRGFSGEGKSPRRSWRSGDDGGAEQRPKRGSSQPSWAAGGSIGGGGVRRWVGGVLLTSIALALIGGFAYFVFIRPRATPLICWHVTDYEAPLVPQAFAQEDIDRFTQLFFSRGLSAGQVSTGASRAIEPANVSTAEEFIEGLAKRVREETPGGPDGVILVYISAQGLVDEQGKPCLLAAAQPRVEKELAQAPTPGEILRSGRLVDLKSLLDRLKEEHPRAWKVVLLDAVRWERNWRLGRAENHFADSLAPLMADYSPTRNADRIVLLNSCSPGEISLADPVQERTLFGDFLASGLAGEADKSRDGRIALAELNDYLAAHVNAAANRRGRIQRPQLILPGSPPQTIDFALARTNRSMIAPRQTGDDVAQRVTDFAARWSRLPSPAAGRGIAAPLVTPLERSRQELLRHEAVLLAGKAYRNVTQPDLPASWPAAVDTPPPTVSLPLSVPADSEPLAAIESNAAAWASRFAPVAMDQPDPVAALAPHQQLYGLWFALRQPGSSATHLFSRAGIDPANALPVELHAAVRFHEKNSLLPARFRTTGGAIPFLEKFLDCRQAAERAAFGGGDPRAYRWIAAEVAQGDAQRREAEDLAFAGGDEQTVLERLATAQERYESAARRAEEVARAFALRDQALAHLPYWLEWSSAGDEQRVELGVRLIDESLKLARLLDEPTDDNAATDLTDAAGHVEQVLGKLQESIDAATTRCLDASFHLGYLPELEQLLAVPLTDPARRQRLWEKYFLVLEGDRAEAAASQAVAASAQRGGASKLLTTWLKLHAAADLQFEPLARQGRDELLKGEKDFALAGDELRQRLAESDRTVRGMAPWLTLVEVRQPTGGEEAARADRPGRHGTVLRQECARHDYYLWQAGRFLEDFLGNDDGEYRALMAHLQRDTLEPYFAAAAAQLADGAARLFPREQQPPVRHQLADRRKAAAALFDHLNQSLQPAANGPMLPDAAQVRMEPKGADPAVQRLPSGKGALHLAGAQFDPDGTGVAVILEPPRDAPRPPSGYFAFAIPGPLASGSPPRVLPEHFQLTLPPQRQMPPWKIAAYYRGHAGALELQLDEPKPGHLLVANHSPDRGNLTVNSSLTDGTVVIVLDCSASMNSEQQRWMADAVEAVRQIIGTLLESKKMEVALVLFAHRRGIPSTLDRDQVNELPWNPIFDQLSAEARDDRATVMFEDDYQMVWSGTAPDDRLKYVLGKEANDQDRIQAAGYTPLYGAIRHAVLEGFASKRRGSRNLVIITDGGDNIPPSPRVETNPAWVRISEYNDPLQRKRRADAALEALAGVEGVEVSLVYLAGLGGGAGPIQEIKENLKIPDDHAIEVRRAGGGAAGPNVQLLVKRLQESVGIYAYDVVEEGGRRTAGSTAERLSFTVHGRTTIEWDDAVQATCEIVGDEALVAEIRRVGKERRLFFLGREEIDSDPLAQRVKLAAAEASALTDAALYPAEYLVACRAQQPKVGDKHRTFEVATRASEPGRFTPRPREMWIEVVPARPADGGQPAMPLTDAEPYFFCQPGFVADSSLPVVQLLAPSWPAGAETALVKVWFRMTDSRQVSKLDESGLKRSNAARFGSGSFTFSTEYLDEPKVWAIKVVETEPRTAGQQPPWSLVTLEGTPADEVRRQFYPENGRVDHLFLFRDLQKTDLSRRAVNIVPQAVWKESATTPAKEFVVTIPRN